MADTVASVRRIAALAIQAFGLRKLPALVQRRRLLKRHDLLSRIRAFEREITGQKAWLASR